MVPEKLSRPDWSELTVAVQEYMEALQNGQSGEDYETEAFEAVLRAVFGPEAFDWINERLEEIEQ